MKIFTLIISTYICVSCLSNKTSRTLHQELLENSFHFITNKEDTLHIHFKRDEVRNYAFGYFLDPNWLVYSKKGTTILRIGSIDNKLVSKDSLHLEFENKYIKFTLEPQRRPIINSSILNGTWIDSRDELIDWDIMPPPPCIFVDTTYYPRYVIKNDSMLIIDFCSKYKTSISVQPHLGYISFWPNYKERSWRIKKLTKTEIILDREYYDRGIVVSSTSNSLQREKNVRLIKYVPNNNSYVKATTHNSSK